jgi:hypothetical protein
MAKGISSIISQNKFIVLFPLVAFFTITAFLVSDNFFFWDTVQLSSVPANYYYQNNFSNFFLPTQHDPGHIPIMGVYLALMWMVFSKTLFVSHLAMLPFIFGIIWQSYNLVSRYISEKKYVFVVVCLMLLDPTFLSQSILISPDIPLLFFFILGLNALLKKRKILFSIAILGLFLMSMRGVVMAGTLLLLDIILNIQFSGFRTILNQLLKKSIKYLPACLFLLGYQYYHYKNTGWVFLHEASPWLAGHGTNDFKGAIYNLGIFMWRLTDFGRVFIYLPLILLFFKNRRKILVEKKSKDLILITVITLIGLISLFLYYRTITGHRYLISAYFIITLLTSYLVLNYIKSKKIINAIFTLLLVGLLIGNFWIYPSKIAQGWDSTLAHVPYYSLHKKMIVFIDNEGIPLNEIASVFPSLGKQKYHLLNNDVRSFKQKNIYEDEYVLYSNIFNDYTDDEVDFLESHFIIKKEFKSQRIFIRLYERTP